MHLCSTCSRLFIDPQALKQHQEATGHCFLCRSCNKRCQTAAGLASHRKAKHEFHCHDCERVFGTKKGLRNHQRVFEHCFCEECDKFFKKPEDQEQHQRDRHGVTTDFHCCICDREFANGVALAYHLVNDAHELPPTPPNPLECVECERVFKHEKALADHLASLKHNPLSSIRCPASAKCKKTFTSPSALCHHLESGMCRSGITRKKLNVAILATDTQGVITSTAPTLLLSNTEGSTGTSTPFVLYTPDTDSTAGVPLSPGKFTPASTPSSLATIPRNPLSCPLCPQTRRPFCTTKDLEQHLVSPAHDAKIYSCPSTLLVGLEEPVVKRFATLSGLTQHLESGACVGGKETLRRAVREVESRLREMGLRWEGVQLLL